MDGGTAWNVNLVKAIERCREDGVKDADITIDVIICQKPEGGDYNPEIKSQNAIDNYLRFSYIKGDKQGSTYRDVIKQMEAFPDVNFRHVVYPS